MAPAEGRICRTTLMEPVPEQFEDPKLQAAVRRAWGGETAPAALRQRVQAMLASEPGVPAPRRFVLWNPLAGVAAAAVVLIAVGIAAHLFFGKGNVSSNPVAPPPPTAVAEAPIPPENAAQLIATHDGCCARHLPNHHLIPSTDDDMTKIADFMRRQLKVPVLAVNLEGWNFDGAGPCPVGGHETCHLLYQRGPDTLSLFTVPLRNLQIRSDGNYASTFNGHVLAAFVRNGACYCLVGAGPGNSMTLADVKSIRNDLEAHFAPPVASGKASPRASVAVNSN